LVVVMLVPLNVYDPGSPLRALIVTGAQYDVRYPVRSRVAYQAPRVVPFRRSLVVEFLVLVHIDIVMALLDDVVVLVPLLDRLVSDFYLDREASKIVIGVFENGHQAYLCIRFDKAVVPVLVGVDLSDARVVGHFVPARILVTANGSAKKKNV